MSPVANKAPVIQQTQQAQGQRWQELMAMIQSGQGMPKQAKPSGAIARDTCDEKPCCTPEQKHATPMKITAIMEGDRKPRLDGMESFGEDTLDDIDRVWKNWKYKKLAAYAELLEKEAGIADVWKGIKHHLPRVRLLDTLAGAGLGAGAGGLTWGAKEMLDPDKEDEDDPRLLPHLLAGAGAGAVGGNIVGDRFRRYMSNAMYPVSYKSNRALTSIKPTWDKIWKRGILDKPTTYAEFQKQLPDVKRGKELVQMRQELLRRGMGLPVSGEPWFRSTGKRQFTPTVRSGGEHGRFEHVEFNPSRIAREVRGAKSTRSNATAQLMRRMASSEPGAAKPFLASHGKEQMDPDMLRYFDLWDFIPPKSERSLAMPYLKMMMKDPEAFRSPVDLKAYDKLQQYGKIHMPKEELAKLTPKMHLKSILLRSAMNKLLPGGGVVFDQRFKNLDPSETMATLVGHGGRESGVRIPR